MGYVRHKYTRAYYLKEDEGGNPVQYGIEGLEAFRSGDIRSQDRDILSQLKLSGQTVLDLGFGRGEALKYAAEHGAVKLVGVDFSMDANVIARDFLESHGISSELHHDDALSFFEKIAAEEQVEKFDVVLMFDFVEHVPRKELSELLTLLHDFLSSRAVIAINTPVFPVDNDVISEGLNPKAADTSDDYVETLGMHCNRYTKESLRSFMRKCGYRAVSGHLFVPKLMVAESFEGSRLARWQAVSEGYPVRMSAVWSRERFEYVLSREELDKRHNKLTRKLPRYAKYALSRATSATLSRLPETLGGTGSKRGVSSPTWTAIEGGHLRGHQMLLDLNSPVFWQGEMKAGTYDSFFIDSLQSTGEAEGGTVWDVGAHIGYHSLSFSSLVGLRGQVIAFEPNPYNLERLEQNLARNQDLAGSICVLPYALSNEDGDAVFVFSSDVDSGKSSGSHLFDVVAPGRSDEYRGFSERQVIVHKGDTLVGTGEVPAPSIIKIDVEGAENNVLEGALQTIIAHSPLLLVEVHGIASMFHVQKTLFGIGYSCRILDSGRDSRSRCFIMAEPTRAQS